MGRWYLNINIINFIMNEWQITVKEVTELTLKYNILTI